jgi:acetyl esterase/lipase
MMRQWGDRSAIQPRRAAANDETGRSAARRGLLAAAALTVAIASTAFGDPPEPTYFNVPYGTHWRQRLDVYLPDDATGPLPVVVYIHGGGWRVGDKELAAPHVEPLWARGFAVVGINYRLSQQALYPAQIHDCKAAIRFLRAHAGEYGLNATRIGVFGQSAGGHLAALLGASGGDDYLEGEVGDDLGFSSAVQAVVDHYGPTDIFGMGEHNQSPTSEESLLLGFWIHEVNEHLDDPNFAPLVKQVATAGAVTYVSPDDPPFLIAHGGIDELVPVSQSRLLYQKLLLAGVPVTLRVVDDAGHGLPASEDEAAYDFLQRVLGSPATGSPPIRTPMNAETLLAVLAAWGPCPTESSNCPADLNRDGVVDAMDLIVVLENWSP